MPPEYSYQAYTSDGTTETGSVEALSVSEAHQYLRNRGLVPVQVGAETVLPEQSWWRRDIEFSGRKAPLAAVAQFCDMLSAFLQAGFPLPKALSLTADSQPHKALQAGLQEAHAQLMTGRSTVEAFARLGKVLPDDLLEIIRLGDTSNRLPDVLSKAAIALRARAQAQSKLRASLVYPGILILAGLALFGVLVFFLGPALQPIFVSADIEPNPVLGLLFSLNDFLRERGVAVAIIAAAIGFGFLGVLSQPSMRRKIGLWMRYLPLIRDQLISSDVAQMARSLSLLIESGVPLPQAFKHTAKGAIGPVGVAASAAIERSETGEPIAPAFDHIWLPKSLPSILKAAEEANDWPRMLTTLADTYESISDRKRERLLQILTPTLTLVIGLSIGFVMLSVVTAMLDINELAFQ